MPVLPTATLAFGLAILMVFVFTRWVEAGLACLLAAVLCNVAFGPNAALIGPFHVSALDIVSTCLLISGSIRFVKNMRLVTWSCMITLGYVSLLFWSFIRGCAANGLFAAANEARGFVGPLVVLLYFADAASGSHSIRRYIRCYLIFAACLCLVALLAVAGLPVGVAAWAHSAAELTDHRVLPSGAAAVLAICGFLALARATFAVPGITALLWPTVFFLSAIYLRHRTVWAMMLAGMLALGFLDGRLFRKILLMMLLAVAAVAGLTLLESDHMDVASHSDFAESLSNTSTWQWRVNGWQEFLFDSDQTALTAIIGKPMGSGWWRMDPETHLLQTAPPHSEYVTEYLRVGAAGLLLILLFALRPMIALAQTRASQIYPCPAIWSVIALVAMVYGTTYSIEPEVYAVIGIANALVNRARATEPPSAIPATDLDPLSTSQVKSGENVPIQTAAVLLTCHNRREITLASLGALFRQRRIGDLETEVFLFDDGCTDGTGEAVRSRFPSVNVLHGDGSFYWNGGMRHALAFAMNLGFDAYILMNDDTMLYPDALQRVVSLARQRIAARAPAIVGGSTLSRLTGEQSYGGLLKKLRGPAVDLHMVKAHPSMPVECHTMHGNFALIPAEIVAAIGPLDDQFQHQFGDLDFGLRATAAGFSVIAVPGIVGDCSANPIEGTWRDRSLGLVERWRHLTSPKGVPFKEWILFTRRHYGWRWLTYACSPYIKTLFTSMLPKPRKTASVKLAMEEGLCEN